MVSPCIDILRQLVTRINGELGARQGSRHATPDLEDDIDTLMASLDEHDVYVEKDGRVLDDDEAPAPDVISVGMAALTHGTSTTLLADFNQQFNILRERRRLTPVADLLGLVNTTGLVSQPVSDSVLPSANIPSADTDEDYADMPGLEEPEDSDDEGAEHEEDLFAESPTLTCLDEGDVDLDMDEVPEWDLDGGDYSGSDSEYEDSGDGGDDE
jgi:hypothetical protein